MHRLGFISLSYCDQGVSVCIDVNPIFQGHKNFLGTENKK